MRSRATLAAVLSAVSAVACCAVVPGVGASAAARYSVRTLHFAVHVGPDDAESCDVVGDLYIPAGADRRHRVPAILTTNGFGGSKDDQAGLAGSFARHEYAVLSYSGLGFGGSGCRISLDSPGYDGRAASQLVSFLGGRAGIAFRDAAHTDPVAPLRTIVHDATAYDGRRHRNDPRVGMIGGSYGGAVQFAAASVDPRIDALIPMITWNDLSYSLDPNNTARVRGVSTSTPGATKLMWGAGFAALGLADGVNNAQVDPSRLLGCPNYVSLVCSALVAGVSLGYFRGADVSALRRASVARYLHKIRVPTLLIQGEDDTLFNLNEAIATYRGLRAQGTTVKMIWQKPGHSDSANAPGEYDFNDPDPRTQYLSARMFAWFGRYLKGRDVSTGPGFAYFRDWVRYSGIATPAYATASTFPVGTARRYYLSGGATLVHRASRITSGRQSMVTTVAGLPTSMDPIDVLASTIGETAPGTEADLPGTSVQWSTAPLGRAVDVAGSPVLRVRLDAPLAAATQGPGPAGQLVVFAKIADVAPDGTASLIHGLVAPARVPDVSQPVTITLPAIVHRFAAGHRIRIVLAGGSVDYRGGLVANPVTVVAGSRTQSLTLPVVR